MTKFAISIKKTKLTKIGHVSHTIVLTMNFYVSLAEIVPILATFNHHTLE